MASYTYVCKESERRYSLYNAVDTDQKIFIEDYRWLVNKGIQPKVGAHVSSCISTFRIWSTLMPGNVETVRHLILKIVKLKSASSQKSGGGKLKFGKSIVSEF